MSNEAIASLGQYMLQGWRLLSTGCPACHTPLVQNPKNDEIYCVSCKCFCKYESEVEPEEKLSEIDQIMKDREEFLNDRKQKFTDYYSDFQDMDDASDVLSDKLLSGWILTAKHCHQCMAPLLDDGDDNLFCYQCEEYIDGDDMEVARPLVKEETSQRNVESGHIERVNELSAGRENVVSRSKDLTAEDLSFDEMISMLHSKMSSTVLQISQSTDTQTIHSLSSQLQSLGQSILLIQSIQNNQ